MKANRKLLLVNLLIVSVALLAIEIVSRRILSNKYNRAFDSSIIQSNKYFDSDGLKPNTTATVWGKHFTTDKFGFRSTGKPFDKKKKTWLFIGDSVTQGVGVDDSSTYVSLITKSLDSMNVVNCSMIGWSVYDYKNVIESLLTDSTNPLNISKITIGWCLNDVYGKAKTNDLPAVGNKGWKSTISAFLHEHYATYRLVKLYATQNSDHYFRYDMQFYRPGNSLLKAALTTTNSIRSLCSSKNIELQILSFPYRSTLEKDKGGEFVSEMKFKSLSSDIKEAAHDIPIRDLYLFSDEIHYSSIGHHIIASDILTHK